MGSENRVYVADGLPLGVAPAVALPVRTATLPRVTRGAVGFDPVPGPRCPGLSLAPHRDVVPLPAAAADDHPCSISGRNRLGALVRQALRQPVALTIGVAGCLHVPDHLLVRFLSHPTTCADQNTLIHPEQGVHRSAGGVRRQRLLGEYFAPVFVEHLLRYDHQRARPTTIIGDQPVNTKFWESVGKSGR